MTESTLDIEMPENAFEVFIAYAAVYVLLMSAGIFAFGIRGESLTHGLNEACAEAAYNSGQKLEAQGSSEQAIQRYRQAMAGQFSDESLRNRCGLSIGDLLFRDNRYSEAVEAYKLLPDSAFESAGSYAGYVGALRKEKELAQAKILANDWLIKAENENADQQLIWAHNDLMRIASDEQNTDEMIRHAEYLVEKDPGSDAHIVLAKIYKTNGETGKAVELLDKLIKNSNNLNIRSQAVKLRRNIQPD